MRYFRYKAAIRSDIESDAAYWFLRITFVFSFISTLTLAYTFNHFGFVILGFVIAVFSYASLAVKSLRLVYFSFWGFVGAATLVVTLLMFTPFSLLERNYLYLTVIYMVQGAVQIIVAKIAFKREATLI